MPLGCEGDCQISRTDVVRTSGNRIPTGGPGTEAKQQTRLVATYCNSEQYSCLSIMQEYYSTVALGGRGAHSSLPTIVQSPLQYGRGTGPSISDARESQHLDLVEHILSQTGELDAVGGVAVHRPEVNRTVGVLLFVHHLIRSGHRR